MRETDGIKEKYIQFVENQYGIPREVTREMSYDEIDGMIRQQAEEATKRKKRGK